MNHVPSKFIEIKFKSWLNIVPIDDDIIVSVCTALFVIKSRRVHQFVNDKTDVKAALIDRHELLAASASYVAVATASNTIEKIVYLIADY